MCHLARKGFWHTEPQAQLLPPHRMVGFATPLVSRAGVRTISHRPRTCVLSSRIVVTWYGDFSGTAEGRSGLAQENPCAGYLTWDNTDSGRGEGNKKSAWTTRGCRAAVGKKLCREKSQCTQLVTRTLPAPLFLTGTSAFAVQNTSYATWRKKPDSLDSSIFCPSLCKKVLSRCPHPCWCTSSCLGS